MIPHAAITLGLLAGGRGRRLGGRDKAWVMLRGRPLVENALRAMPGSFAARLVSTRTPDPRFETLGLRAVFDRRADFAGPLAGLEALAAECRTPWLLSLPVDQDGLPPDVVERLRAIAGPDGAVVQDAGGLQPLLGLWRTQALRDATTALLDGGEAAAHRLVAALRLARLDLGPRRLANLNTPQDFPEGEPT